MKFESYEAKLENVTVLVINRNDTAKDLTTGETVSALKIREKRISGYAGWSGGARPVYTYGAPRWVRASRIS